MIFSPFLDFLKRLLLFSVIIGIIATALWFTLPSKLLTPALPFLVVFFFAITLIGFKILIQFAGKKFIKFLNAFMLLTTVKLFLYIGVMVIYILLNKRDALPFGIAFFLIYLLYTVFEVVSLLKSMKQGTGD
jgi:hypothetical protein